VVRMREGKHGEEEVAEALRRHFGLTIVNVAENEDRYKKVDHVVICV